MEYDIIPNIPDQGERIVNGGVGSEFRRKVGCDKNGDDIFQHLHVGAKYWHPREPIEEYEKLRELAKAERALTSSPYIDVMDVILDGKRKQILEVRGLTPVDAQSDEFQKGYPRYIAFKKEPIVFVWMSDTEYVSLLTSRRYETDVCYEVEAMQRFVYYLILAIEREYRLKVEK